MADTPTSPEEQIREAVSLLLRIHTKCEKRKDFSLFNHVLFMLRLYYAVSKREPEQETEQ